MTGISIHHSCHQLTHLSNLDVVGAGRDPDNLLSNVLSGNWVVRIAHTEP